MALNRVPGCVKDTMALVGGLSASYFILGMLTTGLGPVVGAAYGFLNAAPSSFKFKLLTACFGDHYLKQLKISEPKGIYQSMHIYSQVGARVVKKYGWPITLFFNAVAPAHHSDFGKKEHSESVGNPPKIG